VGCTCSAALIKALPWPTPRPFTRQCGRCVPEFSTVFGGFGCPNDQNRLFFKEIPGFDTDWS
jgi:hypothetical protein